MLSTELLIGEAKMNADNLLTALGESLNGVTFSKQHYRHTGESFKYNDRSRDYGRDITDPTVTQREHRDRVLELSSAGFSLAEIGQHLLQVMHQAAERNEPGNDENN